MNAPSGPLGGRQNDGSRLAKQMATIASATSCEATLTGEEPDISLDEPSAAIDDMSLHIAHWGYLGKVSDLEGYTTADIRRLGLDLKIPLGESLVCSLGIALGLDQNREALSLSIPISPVWRVQLRNHKPLAMALYMVHFHDASSSERIELQHDAGAAAPLQEKHPCDDELQLQRDDLIQNERVELQVPWRSL